MVSHVKVTVWLHCITSVIQTPGGEDAVLVAGSVVIPLLNVHVEVFIVVGNPEEI